MSSQSDEDRLSGLSKRDWAGSTGRYGDLGSDVEWELAIEAYHWDRMEEALSYTKSLEFGTGSAYGGWYRLIEAEGITRLRGSQFDENSWLKIEWIAEEVGNDPSPIIADACEQVAQRFGWDDRPPVLVSVLPIESDAPWAIGRHGYMADKYPYDKICLPNRALESSEVLAEVVSHEYGHVMVLNRTSGLAPTWLDEAIAMLAEKWLDIGMRSEFTSGRAEWLSAGDLDRSFAAERRLGENQVRIHSAYHQAAWIGAFLVHECGEEGIGNVLSAFSDNSSFTDLKMRITGQPAADEAVRQVLKIGIDQLFEKTLDWMGSGSFEG